MNEDGGSIFTIGLVLGAFAVFIIMCNVSGCEQKAFHAEAVAHGAASWEVAPDGSTKFTWKETK